MFSHLLQVPTFLSCSMTLTGGFSMTSSEAFKPRAGAIAWGVWIRYRGARRWGSRTMQRYRYSLWCCNDIYIYMIYIMYIYIDRSIAKIELLIYIHICMKVCICICICICILRSLNCERIGTALSSPKLGLLWRWYPVVNHEVEKNAMGWCLLLWNYMPPFQDSKRQQFTYSPPCWHGQPNCSITSMPAGLACWCRAGESTPQEAGNWGRRHSVWDQENPWKSCFYEWDIGNMGNMGT